MVKTKSISKYYFQLFLVITLSPATLTLQAQEGHTIANENGGRDYGIVYTDKLFYVAGEIIWFKAYLPKTLQYRRSLARIDLVGQNKSVFHTQYVKVDRQNNGSGYYFIPYDFKPGIHYLTVTVFDEDGNFPHTLVYHPVAIYNDLHPLDTATLNLVEPELSPPKNIPVNQNTNLEILMNQSVYRPRQEVKLTIKVTDKKGNPLPANLSISVVDKDLVNSYSQGLGNFSKGPVIRKSFLVDNEIAFRGVVRKIRDSSLYETDYLAAMIREEGLLRLFESYDDGTFEIDLPYFEGSRQVQLLGYFEPDLLMILDEIIQFPENMLQTDRVYTQGILDYLELSRERKKINQLFDQLAFQNLPYPQPPESKLAPDRMLDLSLYEPFESMEEFFKQVVTPLKIKKMKDGGYNIRMVNPEDKPYYTGVPRFLIDGRFIDDPEVAVNLDMKSIGRIDLFYFAKSLRRQFDQFGNSGMVAIYTKEGNFHNPDQLNIFEIDGGLPATDFPIISGATPDSEQKIPVFRPAVYWNPSVNTGQNGEVALSFLHSDDKGTFRVEVLADCENSEIVIAATEYKIE